MAKFKQDVLGLLEELPGYWVLAEEAAECVGCPTATAATVLHRAARAGRIEARPEVWRSSRGRPRLRHWYRLPEQAETTYPEWLEPTRHPVDPQHCRLIIGRASLRNEKMDIRSLDRPLQAQFRNTANEDVADH